MLIADARADLPEDGHRVAGDAEHLVVDRRDTEIATPGDAQPAGRGALLRRGEGERVDCVSDRRARVQPRVCGQYQRYVLYGPGLTSLDAITTTRGTLGV